MYPSCSSFDRSSSDFSFVSGSSNVEKMPVSIKNAKISMMCCTNLLFPPMSISWPKPSCATIAPSLPDAAEIPCAVERYRVGNASPGITKVVVLGPKFWKKLVRQYRKTNASDADGVAVSLSYAKPTEKQRREWWFRRQRTTGHEAERTHP